MNPPNFLVDFCEKKKFFFLWILFNDIHISLYPHCEVFHEIFPFVVDIILWEVFSHYFSITSISGWSIIYSI